MLPAVGRKGVQVEAGNCLRSSLMLAMVACISACGNKEDAKSFAEKYFVPSPAVSQVEPWGKSGSQEICKIKHGPFVAWEDGYVHLCGSSEAGSARQC